MAASLISACFLSVFFFEFVLTSNFLLGAAVVVVATFMYLLEDDVIGRPIFGQGTHCWEKPRTTGQQDA